jgi:hypothetical protein
MARVNPYLNSENPKMLPSYCVYLDILGFKETFSKSFAEKKLEEFFDKYYKAITEVSGLIRKDEKDDPYDGSPALWQQKIFTDNVVLGYPIKSRDGEGEFGNLIIQLTYTQMSLALEGFFLRGGFSLGDLYIDDKMVFGDALIDAYKLENEKANNPRIIISDSVMELVKHHITYYAKPEIAPHNDHILIDVDNQPYVNYLVTTIADENYLYEDALFSHKEIIEKNLKDHIASPRVWNKYLWVANYHNYFCDSVREYDGFSQKLLIDTEVLKQKLRRLSEIIKG